MTVHTQNEDCWLEGVEVQTQEDLNRKEGYESSFLSPGKLYWVKCFEFTLQEWTIARYVGEHTWHLLEIQQSVNSFQLENYKIKIERPT